MLLLLYYLLFLLMPVRNQQNVPTFPDSINPNPLNIFDTLQPRPAGWWHLYGFGECFFDSDILGKPWNDQQIDLDFFFPFYGFRFNYTFIFPEGFIAFSYPNYIQPPYTFPNPKWPDQYDPSFVAAFMMDQQPMFVGDTGISHVWYRVISRPTNLIGMHDLQQGYRQEDVFQQFPDTFGSIDPRPSRCLQRTFRGQRLKIQDGRTEDPALLDQITEDLRRSMVGTRGFTADYALIVTWERMGYGGAPKTTQLNKFCDVRRWQNTYQMVIATDEIRSYAMFNFANINWTSSTSSGALFGRGGKQSALVGFNGGNGTGWFELPYSAEGNSYKLVQFGSTETAGRWLARVDEQIQYGGCTNESIGILQLSDTYATMLGGFSLNASGPCYRPSAIIKMQIDELTLDCERINMVVARCVVPVNSMFRTGMVDVKISTDGGKNYPFWNKFYVLQPAMARQQLNLINDPLNLQNNWQSVNAENLTLTWPAMNISNSQNAQVDITLWGYWEDVEGHNLIEIGTIARRTTNTGAYSFNPRTLSREGTVPDAWKKYYGGLIQVRVADNWMSDRGDGLYWSMHVPFGWFWRDTWQYQYGSNWATDLCIDWFDYDGRRVNFIRELEPKIGCPCVLDQALMDMGRFTPLHDCDMTGNSYCYYTQGAQHCVVSTVSIWTGAAQMCCYDQHGWLMFSDDFEYNTQYLRFYSAGVPYRAHPWGSYPYKRPPFVPSMSHFYNDLMPYEFCCKWAGHCEFYFWRRQSSGCQSYRPPTIAFAYGEPHFITYDGFRYTFNGKGFYILTMMKSPVHNLMAQIRMEQPPRTQWDTDVRATVITGFAAQDNSSSVVQIYARKDFRRWRYKTDIYVDGKRIFFDKPWKKLQTFTGVTLRSPARNMNHSEIDVMFTTGVGFKVFEARGLLNIMTSMPPNYKETWAYLLTRQRQDYLDRYLDYGKLDENQPPPEAFGTNKCTSHVRTLGLLGTFNNDKDDDLTTPDCFIVRPGQGYPMNELDSRNVYSQFGEKWRVDGIKIPSLFQVTNKFDNLDPIYDPLSFADKRYQPIFDPWRSTNVTFYENLVFTREQVQVTCQSEPTCEFDYIMTGRREIGMDTLDAERKFEGLKAKGSQILTSCGTLTKYRGVIKHPPGNNYLDGVTVTFSCKPDYFLHGEQQRTCVNGTWSAGWWAWCRRRNLEIGLKWLTAILVLVIIAIIIISIFCVCWVMGKRNRKGFGGGGPGQARYYAPNPNSRGIQPPPPPIMPKGGLGGRGSPQNLKPPVTTAGVHNPPSSKSPTTLNGVPDLEREPVRPFVRTVPTTGPVRPVYSETSA